MIRTENPKRLYDVLYKELKSKHSAVAIYAKDAYFLPPEEKAIATAIKDFVKLYEKFEKEHKWSIATGSTEEYATVKFDLAEDESLGKQLEEKVQAIRTALSKSVEDSLPPPIDIDEMKRSGIYEERFSALNASVSDRMGEWVNEKIARMEESARRNNLEFAHRPELYMQMKNAKTGKVETVKAERYVSYAKRVSKEYRFFERSETEIVYDRRKDPDAYTVAPLALRDILENHKDRKVEAERRREYVKFIQDQHQAHALWKENMPKYQKRYQAILDQISPEVRERFDTFMDNYNGMKSRQCGVDAWLQSEASTVEMRKQEIENIKKQWDVAFNVYEAAQKPLEDFEKQAEEELEAANGVIEQIKQSPLLKEGYKEQVQEKLKDRLEKEGILSKELELLDTELQKDIDDREVMRKSLMGVMAQIDDYVKCLNNLKTDKSAANIKAVNDYHKILFTGQIKLVEALKGQSEKIQQYTLEIPQLTKHSEDSLEKLSAADKTSTEKRVIKENLEKRRDMVVAFLKDPNMDKVKSEIKAFKKQLAKDKVNDEETVKLYLENEYTKLAEQNHWPIGKDLKYVDTMFAEELKKEVDEATRQAKEAGIAYTTLKDTYTTDISNANNKSYELGAEIDSLVESVNLLKEKITNIQEQSIDALLEEMDQIVTEKVDKEGAHAENSRAAIERGFKDIHASINQKTEAREALVKLVNAAKEERVRVEEELKVVIDEEIRYQNEVEKVQKLITEKEKKKEELKKIVDDAYNAWKNKKEIESKAVEEGEKYIKDYEFIQEKLVQGEEASLRLLRDMNTAVLNQQEKLSADAEAQKTYLELKEKELCAKYEKQLRAMKNRFLGLAEPSGKFKMSNSKEFTALSHKFKEFFEPNFPNPKGGDPISNPHYVLFRLEDMNYFFGNDKVEERNNRIDILRDVADAMNELNKELEKYLDAKGDPVRSTELGRARYTWANDMKTMADDIEFEFRGLINEESYCDIAPDLSKVKGKSGLKDVEFVTTAGYKYTKEAIEQETDVLELDNIRQMAMDLEAKQKKQPKVNEQPELGGPSA